MARATLRGSIRFKITALAALLAGLILVFAAIALVALQRQQLTTNLDNSLEQRADAYEATLSDQDDSVALSRTNDEDRAIQLVDGNGDVVIATANISGHPPLRPNTDAQSRQVIDEATLPRLEDDTYRILSRPIEAADGPAILHVAQNIDDLNDTIRGLTIALAIAVPAVVALLAALTWWLVGRTLHPVEHIRAEVADISGTALDRRVPVSDQWDEIAQLATTMNQMLDRLDNASRRQRQFVADASHELRTPLTRIRTEVEVDLNQPENADPTATNETVLEELIGIQNLLDDLLFLARSDENQAPRRNRPIDLDDIVLAEITDVGDQHAIRIDVTGVSAAHLTADPAQLARVIRNLLSNAVRHATSQVTVTLTENNQSIELTITDDGPGVPAEARDHIFERFARADDARTRAGGGAGLGLAIVRDIINRHDGTVTYQNAPTGGASFVVTLPKSREDDH